MATHISGLTKNVQERLSQIGLGESCLFLNPKEFIRIERIVTAINNRETLALKSLWHKKFRSIRFKGQQQLAGTKQTVEVDRLFVLCVLQNKADW